MDFERARRLMVEAQLRPFDITDADLLDALRRTARERFVPAPLRSLAYSDQDLEVYPGRRMLRPRVLGRLLQALDVKREDRALEIAGGLGYGAAVLSHLAAEATLLESISQLAVGARTALDSVGAGKVRVAATDLRAGWREGAPYDVILVQVGVEVIPDAWLEQLAEGGRLALVIREGFAGYARLITKFGGAISARSLFEVQVDVAPELERPRSFVF